MSWTCVRCETVNPETNHICEVCDTEKPHPVKPTSHYEPLPSVVIESKPERKSSKSWTIGIMVLACLCLTVASFSIIGISNQNIHASQTAVSQSMTATAWAIPSYSQTFDSAPEWEWDDSNGTGFIVEYGKIKGEVTGQIAAWTLAGQSFST